MAFAARRLRAWSTGLVLVLILGGAGCSRDDEPGADSPTTPSASAAEPTGTGSRAADDASSADAAAAAARDLMEAYDGLYPGVMALIRVGEETRFVTQGYANVAGKTTMTARDRFHIASITKPMVAAVAMELVAADRLRLSDTVERWLPGLVPGHGRVTVEQLLSMRSGMPEYANHIDVSQHYEPQQLVRIALKKGQPSEPGTSLYINTNYVLLGLILEQATNQSMRQLLQQRVFDPAGMTDTSFVPTAAGEVEIRGYDGTTDVTAPDLSAAWTAGGVVSSARDVDAFWTALMAGEVGSAAMLDDMTTMRGQLANLPGSYGLGLGADPVTCGEIVGHGGGIEGFAIEMWGLRGQDRSVVVLVNDQNAGDLAGQYVSAVLCT